MQVKDAEQHKSNIN